MIRVCVDRCLLTTGPSHRRQVLDIPLIGGGETRPKCRLREHCTLLRQAFQLVGQRRNTVQADMDFIDGLEYQFVRGSRLKGKIDEASKRHCNVIEFVGNDGRQSLRGEETP